MKSYIDTNKLSPKLLPDEPSQITQPKSTETAKQKPSKEQHEVDFVDIELSSMRKTIAKRLVESKVKQYFLQAYLIVNSYIFYQIILNSLRQSCRILI